MQMNSVRLGMPLVPLTIAASLLLNGCGIGGCSKYASQYSCSYVENDADYEVWYWRQLDRDDEADNKMIGRAKGLHMCEENAMAFAAAVGEEFIARAYICVLMKDGNRMEKHRLLAAGVNGIRLAILRGERPFV